MKKAPLLIETSRLRLSPPQPGDAAAIFERYAGDPEVTRFLGWPCHRSVGDTEQFLAFSAAEWGQSPAGPYLIRSRADGRLLGGTGLGFDGRGQAVTGYVLATDAWGKGFATEALLAMVETARQIGSARLSAICHARHHASWRVLEKCGFARHDRIRCRAEFPNLAPGVRQDAWRYTLAFAPHPDRAG